MWQRPQFSGWPAWAAEKAWRPWQAVQEPGRREDAAGFRDPLQGS